MKLSSFFQITFLSISVFVVSLGTTHATSGCNAVGWEERHGMIGCDLYFPAVQWLYNEGIASGDAATGKFFPERSINRAEFTKLVLLASGVKNPPACSQAPFPDVPKDAWFAPYICAAKDKGIISGFPDGTFKPSINVNFANGAKILAKTFDVPLNINDAQFDSTQNIWYRPYTVGLLNKGAVAETITAFSQDLSRGEMAEMLYRLTTGKNYFKEPIATGDGDYLGFGFGPYSLEPLSIYLSDTPNVPYIFTPSELSLDWYAKSKLRIPGFRFSHVIQSERCTESGLFEHCRPTFTDWTVGLHLTSVSLDTVISELESFSSKEERYFGGKPGSCYNTGIEGKYTEYCFVPLANKKTFVTVRDYINTDFAYGDTPGITPIATSDAMFARIRKSIQFFE